MQDNNMNIEQIPATVIELDEQNDENQQTCPKCGTVNLTLDEGTGHYTCNYCQHEFKPVKELTPEQLAKINATQPNIDYSNMATLKCKNCGTEVIIDKAFASQSKCHWCKHPLDPTSVVQTRSVPSVVLPFGITREDAQAEMEKFIEKKKLLILPDFLEGMKPENIIPIYIPYVLVDINSHGKLIGQGEHQVKKYYNVNQSGVTYYDADTYTVEREYDLLIDGLMIENGVKSNDKMSTIINAIKPFDLESARIWDANYLRGCTSENRNIDFNYLQSIIEDKAKLETKLAANKTLEEYDRGVVWSTQEININKEQWKIIYLPVWFYSYPQESGDKKTFNYIAVNGRSKETAGVLPLHTLKLIGASVIVELLGILFMFFLKGFSLNFIFLFAGLIFFFVVKMIYQNVPNKMDEEVKPNSILYNVRQLDKILQRKTGLRTTSMVGANNTEPLDVNTDVIYDERDNSSQSNKEFTKQK